MFELSFVFWFCVLLIFFLPLLKNPVSMAGLVVAMSLCMVSLVSLFSSFWFSYVLFLVYVGGLLVVLIYICLVSSNYPFSISVSGFICCFLGSCLFSLGNSSLLNPKFLGFSTWTTGESLLDLSNMSIFLFLAVLLLSMLLVVVRISGSGCFVVSDGKN